MVVAPLPPSLLFATGKAAQAGLKQPGSSLSLQQSAALLAQTSAANRHAFAAMVGQLSRGQSDRAATTPGFLSSTAPLSATTATAQAAVQLLPLASPPAAISGNSSQTGMVNSSKQTGNQPKKPVRPGVGKKR